ncbi:diguanylate cyclase, partial [Streptomyces sp. or43]
MTDALLDTLFSQSAVGLHVLDTELRVVRVNSLSDAVAPEHIVGLHFTEAYRVDDPEGSEELLRGVLESGVPVLNHVIRGQLRGAPGPDRSLTVTVHRLDDPPRR